MLVESLYEECLKVSMVVATRVERVVRAKVVAPTKHSVRVTCS